MILNEIYEKSPDAYQDLSQDNSQPKLSDTRKTRLTLGQLNELRKNSEAHILDQERELAFIHTMYAAPPPQAT